MVEARERQPKVIQLVDHRLLNAGQSGDHSDHADRQYQNQLGGQNESTLVRNQFVPQCFHRRPFLGSGGPQRIGRSDACDRCLAARSGSRRDACPARRHGTHHPQPNPSQVANGFDNGWRAVPLRRTGKNKGPAGATHPPVAQLSAAAVSQVATHARTAKKMGAALNRDRSVSSGLREASRSLCGRCNRNSHFNQCNRHSQSNRP